MVKQSEMDITVRRLLKERGVSIKDIGELVHFCNHHI